MSFVLILTARAAKHGIDTAAVGASLNQARHCILHTPAATHDPYLDDGAPPSLIVEALFDRIEALEAALLADGPLKTAIRQSDADWSEQAMVQRDFPVPHPGPHPGLTPTPKPAPARCTYFVSYFGVPEDLGAWLAHYITHHPPIMARFPAIRQIAVYTCLDWCSGLAIPREHAFQRNKVVFDDPAGLTTALNSPVRHEMRADYQTFPKFEGQVTHFPMLSQRGG